MVEHSTPRRPTAGQATRAYLDVPYAEKDAAKALGARWDQTARRWYDPRPPTAGLERWVARPPVPDLLPEEDRTFGAGLFVDMVPSSCWFTNVRSCVTPQDWERLRRMITSRAGHQCEACGADEDRTVRRWLEAHERWAYHDRTGVQALRRLICLCSDCHLSTHLGHANVTGRADQALAHLRAVTGMTDAEVSRHVDAAGDLWTRRSARIWTLDLTMLTDAGVTLARPEKAADRPAAAERALRRERERTPEPIPAQRQAPPRMRPPTAEQRAGRTRSAQSAHPHCVAPQSLGLRHWQMIERLTLLPPARAASGLAVRPRTIRRMTVSGDSGSASEQPAQPLELGAGGRAMLADTLEELAAAVRDDRAAVYEDESSWRMGEPSRLKISAVWWPETPTPDSLEARPDPSTGFPRWDNPK
jgi:hypothetical protein